MELLQDLQLEILESLEQLELQAPIKVEQM